VNGRSAWAGSTLAAMLAALAFAGDAWADTPPSNQSPPVISGPAQVGRTLNASTGTWSGSEPMSFSIQWQLCSPLCGDIVIATGTGARGPTYVPENGDPGWMIRVVVTASNSAGSASSVSAMVGPVTFTRAYLKALLLSEISPKGRAARIRALLRDGGYAFPFIGYEIGRERFDWYSAGLHVAAGRLTFAVPGDRKIKIRLTRAGRRLLRGASRLKLTVRSAFTPQGDSPVVARKTVILTPLIRWAHARPEGRRMRQP